MSEYGKVSTTERVLASNDSLTSLTRLRYSLVPFGNIGVFRQDYNFSVGGRYAFIPSKSYFRVSMKLQRKDGGTLSNPRLRDNIAFATNPVSNLFTNCYFRAGGSDVSSIVNRSAQAHQVKTRLSRSGAWLNSIGKSAYFYEGSFVARINETAEDGFLGGDEKVYQQKIGSNPAATVAITAATGAVVGVNTLFATAPYVVNPGDKLVVAGVPYNIITRTDNTNLVVDPPPRADIGATTNAYVVSAEGASNQKSEIDVLYQPPIGIFDYAGALGAGQYRIQLNPNSNYKKACVQALEDKSLTATDNSYDVEITDIQFFACIEKSDLPTTGDMEMELMEMQVQSKTLTNQSSSNVLDFTVPPSTRAISVFVASGDAGSNNIVPLTNFQCKDSSELNLKGIQLTYSGVTKPSTNFRSEYAGDKNFMKQRYLDTQIASGLAFSVGGAESYNTWLNENGPLMHYDMDKDAEDRSTNLQLNIEYGNIEASANVFIVAHYTRVVKISTTNGMISNVASLSI